MAMTSEYPFIVEILTPRVEFLTPTQPIVRARLGWGQFVPGDVSYEQRVSAIDRADPVRRLTS